MKLTIVGCSPAWPNPGGAQSGYLVESDGTRVLIDCGPGVLPRLLEHERWPRIDAIVISHLHLDHWGDLVPWAFGMRWGTGQGAASPALWVRAGQAATLRGYMEHVGSPDTYDSAFDVREYGDDPFRIGPLELTARVVPHYDALSCALRIHDGGATLAYSSDCGPNEALVEVARDADLFLCEATLGEPEPEPRGHLTEDEALSISERAGVGRLLVVHRPFELPLRDGVERGEDGQVVEL